MSSERPAPLALERNVASETIETELSQVKTTACVTRAVLFEHGGSDGLVQAPGKAVTPAARGASACFALVTASVGSVTSSTSNHFVSEAFTRLSVRRFCYQNSLHRSNERLPRLPLPTLWCSLSSLSVCPDTDLGKGKAQQFLGLVSRARRAGEGVLPQAVLLFSHSLL